MKYKLIAALYLLAFAVSMALFATPLALAAPAAPTGVAVEQDDNNARLTWGLQMNNGNVQQNGIAGYKIVWGPAADPAANKVLTEYRAIQLQPLVNGQPYTAAIQTLDYAGNSSPATTVSFTGNTSRVNALRLVDTGFFDDFNSPAGAFDELKWNQAVSKCADPGMTTSFINDQFHSHNMINSGFCDRSQMINRPRQTFDFTNRTGTISFDMDGSGGRQIWYLDLLPASLGPVDITSHVDFFDASSGHPGNELRISQSNSSVSIGRVDTNGKESTIATTDWSPYPPIDTYGFVTIPNFRRHWEIKVSQTSVSIKIDGQVVLAKDLSAAPLPFSKATVHWNFFSYNTPKDNLQMVMTHWDNFGFDGPAPSIETHNYRTAQTNSRDYVEANTCCGPAVYPSASIEIPDSLAGSTAQRLMFTIQAAGYQTYNWKSGDKVVVNGTSVAIPQITPVAGGIDSISPYSVILPVPASLFHTGTNTVQFVSSYLGALNIHAEFDFSKGSAPAFTQPNTIYPQTASQTPPMTMGVGPAVNISDIGSVQTWTKPATFPVKGTVAIKLGAYGSIPLESTGKNTGITKLQLRVDKTVVKEWNTSVEPVPSNYQTYQLDTTKLSNGNHNLDVVAFDPAGDISTPDYFESFQKPGDFAPFVLAVNNPGTPVPTVTAAPATATATASPTPAPTATSVPTPNPTAVPTATSVPATATAVPTATTAPTATLIPSTATPAPTATAAPTDTIAPTASPSPTPISPIPTITPAPTFTPAPTGTVAPTSTPAPTTGPSNPAGTVIHQSGLLTPDQVDAWYNSLVGSSTNGHEITSMVPAGLWPAADGTVTAFAFITYR